MCPIPSILFEKSYILIRLLFIRDKSHNELTSLTCNLSTFQVIDLSSVLFQYLENDLYCLMHSCWTALVPSCLPREYTFNYDPHQLSRLQRQSRPCVCVSVYFINRILSPCNNCHHPWCVGDKSYHKAL